MKAMDSSTRCPRAMSPSIRTSPVASTRPAPPCRSRDARTPPDPCPGSRWVVGGIGGARARPGPRSMRTLTFRPMTPLTANSTEVPSGGATRFPTTKGMDRCAPVERHRLSHPVATAGTAEGPSDVLLVGPGVEDSGLHELAVGDLAHRAPPHLVELGRGHGPQGVESSVGGVNELVQHLVAGPAPAGGDPGLVQLAEGVGHVVGDHVRVAVGADPPAAVRSMPMRWESWSLTVHPGQSVGRSHWAASHLLAGADQRHPHLGHVVDDRFVVRRWASHALPFPEDPTPGWTIRSRRSAGPLLSPAGLPRWRR